jgi:hypothetical protein
MPDRGTKVAEGTCRSKYRDLLRSLREKYSPNQFVESFCSCKLLPNLYIGKNQGPANGRQGLALPACKLYPYRSGSTFI